MTANGSFDRRLAGWLVDEAQGRVSDHLDEVLVATRATRQRRGRASLERWLPMTSITNARLFVPRPVLPILLVLALVAAALMAFVLLQAGHSNIPFGQAGNGRIVYIDGTSVRSVAADGSDPQTITTLPNGLGLPAISPDGQLVALTAEENRIEIVPVAGATGRKPIQVRAPGMAAYGAATWSPAGDQIAFVAADPRSDHLFIANADGTNVHEIGLAMVDQRHGIGWAAFSPDGRLVGFTEGPQDGPFRLVVVAPDGSGARALSKVLVETGGGGSVSWSPNPAVSRILYVGQSQIGNRYFDVAADAIIPVALGFWPSWSPRGDRIAYWADGTKVIDTPTSSARDQTPTEIFPSFGDNCQDHPELAGNAFCGPATWSPDGSRLVATEITGNGLLSLRSDGEGDPRFIDLETNVNPGEGSFIAWQPILQNR
jgi:hypothetical protein